MSEIHPRIDPSINGDMSRRVTMDTGQMEWQASPSGTVFRKRVHLVGPAESGQVTSVVRYQPEASFPAHDHPGGEEILVLQGVFSDEHGDWPAGTYLLNPEGFRHAPFSRGGCEIFVKLRQYAGAREHHAIDTNAATWRPGPQPGIDIQPLYRESGFPDAMSLERWSPGTSLPATARPGGVEIFVLEGGFEDKDGHYGPGAWLRLPDGAIHQPRSETGCVLYMKAGAVADLRSA